MRATQAPPEGGVGVGSGLYNGVSRNCGRSGCKAFGQHIHVPNYTLHSSSLASPKILCLGKNQINLFFPRLNRIFVLRGEAA